MDRLFHFIKKRRNFIMYSSLNMLIMILSLTTNIIIIRKLNVDEFGVFSVVLMLIGFITNFGFSWSSSSIVYFGSKEKAKYGSINKTFWARNIIIFFSLIITTIMFVVFREQINDYVGLNISFLILIWLYVSVIENYLNQYFLAVKRQLLSSILSVSAKVIYIGLVLLIPFDVPTLIILNIISHATVIFYLLGINKRDIGKFEFDRQWFNEVLNFSLWQLFGFSGIYIINFGDIAVIKYFMTENDVGIYNAAYQLFMGVTGFANVISSYYAASISSYFANGNKLQIKRFYYKERLYIFVGSILVHLVLLFLTETIILTLYGEQYRESVNILRILLFGSMIRYFERFYMLYYNSNSKHKVQQIINIFGAIVNLGLSILLINVIGIVGPAVATMVSFMITFLFSIIYCENKIRNFIRT